MHEPQRPLVVLVGSKAKEGEGVVYYNMREFLWWAWVRLDHLSLGLS